MKPDITRMDRRAVLLLPPLLHSTQEHDPVLLMLREDAPSAWTCWTVRTGWRPAAARLRRGPWSEFRRAAVGADAVVCLY